MLAGCCDRQDFYFGLGAIALCIGLMISNSGHLSRTGGLARMRNLSYGRSICLLVYIGVSIARPALGKVEYF